jgi:RecA/RadA recombinase
MAKKDKKGAKKSEGSFFDDLLKKVGLDIPVATEVNDIHKTTFFSTGSLMLNALVSSSMNGGLAGNKITALAGEEATGKTFIALQCIKHFLDEQPTGHVFIFDSEDDPSKTEAVMKKRGIDTSRVHVKFVKTIQEFRQLMINIIDGYLEQPVEKRQPMFMVLDSLGNLSTLKELHDTAKGALNKKGEDVRDMTRTSLIRGLFRVLTIKLGEANVPLLITNHTYQTMNPYGAATTMSGGGGLRYAASTIIYLTKKKLRDADKDVIGSILTATLDKSRFTPPGLKADLLLTHAAGLDKYWGLFEFGLETGILIKGTGVAEKNDKSGKKNGIKANSYKFPDGQIADRKEIEANPSMYFDTDINFAAFEEQCAKTFQFGEGQDRPISDEDEADGEIDIDAAVAAMQEAFEAVDEAGDAEVEEQPKKKGKK